MVRRGSSLLVVTVAFAVLASPQPAAAEDTPDFGDDDGEFARDGECDDWRFEGPGMTDTPLIEQDVRHDATDCRVAFQQGRLTFRGDDVIDANVDEDDVDRIMWGDDSSPTAKDGKCGDMRFAGPGMSATELLVSDVKGDATDCRVAFRQGQVSLRE